MLDIATPREGVVLLTLNRPEARNALSMALREAITSQLDACRADPATRCVVIAGGERVFAAGADIREMRGLSPGDMMMREIERHWRALADFPKPMIAAVRGAALGGGCELAMHADIIIAGRSARFALPEVALGLMPGGGGTQRLVRAVGKFRAMRYLMTGDPISAAEALAMGLVSELVEDKATIDAALELGERIARGAPLALRQIKEAVLRGGDAPLETGLALERKAAQALFASHDLSEGLSAFLEKRPPRFKGR